MPILKFFLFFRAFSYNFILTRLARNDIINLYKWNFITICTPLGVSDGSFLMLQIREIRVRDLVRYLLCPAAFVAAIWVGFVLFRSFVPSVHFLIPLAVGIALSYLFLKNLLIGLVLLYKAIAPMSIRNRCRFEPSCSTYMIMALKKYGALVGFCKGLRRISRCHAPNGGVDLP